MRRWVLHIAELVELERKSRFLLPDASMTIKEAH
jgi:hypothetical protein